MLFRSEGMAGHIKVMKENNLQPRLLNPARISFKYEGEIKSFKDKQKLAESDTTEATADTHRCAAICGGPASDGPGGRPLPSRPLLHSLATTLDGSDGGCLLSLTV